MTEQADWLAAAEHVAALITAVHHNHHQLGAGIILDELDPATTARALTIAVGLLVGTLEEVEVPDVDGLIVDYVQGLVSHFEQEPTP